ncbi:unnamed protein product [Arctogadus glacialis]
MAEQVKQSTDQTLTSPGDVWNGMSPHSMGHSKACMCGLDYFQFTYWPQPSAVFELRCWHTPCSEPPPPCLPPASQAAPAGRENGPFDGPMEARGEEAMEGVWEKIKVPGSHSTMTDRAGRYTVHRPAARGAWAGWHVPQAADQLPDRGRRARLLPPGSLSPTQPPPIALRPDTTCVARNLPHILQGSRLSATDTNR